jgi:hypothetical protein
MPAAEANKLLTRSQWREGNVWLLEAVAARLEVPMPDQGDARPMPRSGNHG